MKKNINKPLVSILMTAYNAEAYIEEAVNSVLGQTYSNIELIVVDDKSSDRTLTILREITKNDKRVRVIAKHKNGGPSVASNLGLKYIKGKYLARMDADDVSYQDRIAKQVEYMESNKDVIAVGGQCELIDKNGNSIGMKQFPTKTEKISEALYMYNPMQHPSMMVNLELLPEKKFRYNENSVLAHDLELLYMLDQYGRLANLPDTVLKYRYHGDSLSLNNPRKTFVHTVEVREVAKDIYGYSPTFKAKIVDAMQRIVMTILPNSMVYPLFRVLRMNSMDEIGEVSRDVSRYVAVRVRAKIASVAALIAGLVIR